MSNLFTERVLNMAAVTPQPEDYTGEDGLLYCGKCHTPKEAYFPEKQAALFGRDRHPAECDCQKAQRLEREAAEQRRKHLDTVEDLKRRGFTNPTMQEWTFANDNGKCPQMEIAHFYVEHWEIMREENIGYLLWGKVGTGKSYFAGCIANALMEQEVAVRMTNFSAILNDLTASFEGRNEYIECLCRFPLLTINRAAHKSTRYYIDEMHLLLKEEQTAAYTVEIWKRFRKWGGIPTGITQNVKDLLSSREVENIFENSDFVYMLNQAGGDRQILAKQLGISTHQLSYVTHSGEGEGLLFYGSTILPFVDHFPKNTELYRIMTTKPQELKKKEDE